MATRRTIIRVPRRSIGIQNERRESALVQQMELPSEQNEPDAPRLNTAWLALLRQEALRQGLTQEQARTLTGVTFMPQATYFTTPESASSATQYRFEPNLTLFRQALHIFPLPGVLASELSYAELIEAVGRSVRAVHTALSEVTLLKYEAVDRRAQQRAEVERVLLETKLQPILAVSLEHYIWFNSPDPAVYGPTQLRFGWRVDEQDDDFGPNRMSLIDRSVIDPLKVRILRWFGQL